MSGVDRNIEIIDEDLWKLENKVHSIKERLTLLAFILHITLITSIIAIGLVIELLRTHLH